MWRMDPLLSRHSVSSGRCLVTPASCTHAIIEQRRFLCGLCRDCCNATARQTRLYNNTGSVFSVWSVSRSYLKGNWHYSWVPRVEEGSNTSIVALRVAGGDEEEPSAWRYNRATLFLEDIHTGTWFSTLAESRIWDSKMWSWISWDSVLRMTALARASNHCKRQTHPLVTEDVT
jgi:hypothetical protein